MGHRFRVHHPALRPVAGGLVELSPEESHHVHRVLRLRPGERLGVFDGAGVEWEARIVAADSSRVTLCLEQEASDPATEPELPVVLFQALLRAELMEWVIQKATEIGVAAVRPLPAARAERYTLTPARLERWRRIALESCKQCGRRALPAITPATALPPLDDPQTLALLLDPTRGAPPLAVRCRRARPPRIWIVAGPQGGLAPEEVEQAAARGWLPASLGPRVLRAETAGAVAAAIVLHRWADLGR